MDDTKLPEIVKPKHSRKTHLAKVDNKPLTKRQLEVFELYESGLTQQQIADKLSVKQPYISELLKIHASRYRTNREFIKLNNINVLQNKINEKVSKPSSKDVVDIIESLHNIVEPKKESVLIDNRQLTINASDLDNLSQEEKLERLRRALSD